MTTGQRDDTMWIPTAQNAESVLEFVAVGTKTSSSLCPVVKGGGEGRKLGCIAVKKYFKRKKKKRIRQESKTGSG